MTGRDVQRILGFRKDSLVDVRPLNRAAEFFGSDQSRSVWVSTGRAGLRSWILRCAVRGVGFSIV